MRTLGVGTYARVILARHHKDLKYYAIKVLKKSKVRWSLYSRRPIQGGLKTGIVH